MASKSLWQSYSDDTTFPALKENLSVDVAIIGGGITGVELAKELSKQNVKVALLEGDKIGVSTTGHSTGNLYCVTDKVFTEIEKKFDLETFKKVIASRKEGMEQIAANVKQYGIDCDFKRTPWIMYSADPRADKKIEKDLATGKRAGLDVIETDVGDPRLTSRKAVKLEGQAQFNPLRYTQGLAKAIANDNCLIFEHSYVEDIQSEGEGSQLSVNGKTVKATHVVHATHTPKGIKAVHTLMEPYREYGIACKLKGKEHPEGTFWGYYKEGENTSTRSYERNGEKYMIVVGQHHKVGTGDIEARIKRLEEFARNRFDVENVTHRWGGQHYSPADHLPYIGKIVGGKNNYIATGFSTSGLVYGVVAAAIIRDQILGKKNQYEDLYSATRITPGKSFPKFAKANAENAVQMAKDYLVPKDKGAALSPGEGKVLKIDGNNVAAYRDENGEVSFCSAVCTHMKCLVHWNQPEKSWDCPCHGSRFTVEGEVIEGPALEPLKKLES